MNEYSYINEFTGKHHKSKLWISLNANNLAFTNSTESHSDAKRIVNLSAWKRKSKPHTNLYKLYN